MTLAYARVTRVFVRLLGLVFLLAFASVAVQVKLLMGSEGLLPLAPVIEAAKSETGSTFLWEFPTLFWFNASDPAILGSAWLGAALGGAMLLGLRSRVVLLAAWVLFLSLVIGGRSFFSFQWDNLLLETSFLALFLPMPWLAGHPARRPEPAPSRISVFLMRWLLFRLLFESGISKLLPGAHGWTDLSAMTHYYETAPLPTWLGWVVHQLPTAFGRAASAFTLVIEIGVPLLVFGPRKARLIAFGLLLGFQIAIFATANYGYFNILCGVLLIWLLEDRDIEAASRRLRLKLSPLSASPIPAWRTPILGVVAVVLVGASLIECTGLFTKRAADFPESVKAFRGLYLPLRIVNTYHLFAGMTERRVEASFEGSDDGVTWRPYRLKYKPGDPTRRPSIVAPHQPRVDFQLWFFTLSNPESPRHAYVRTLLARICHAPAAVKGLWSEDPFSGQAPGFLRIGFDEYRFTDLPTLRRTGRWWIVSRIGTSRELSCTNVPL